MQRLLISILFIAIHTALIAQPITENLSLEQPELKILYIGMPNKIKVTSPKPNSAIELKTNNTKSSIYEMDSCLFHVYPVYSSGIRTEVLEIHNDTSLVKTDTFALHKLPNPEVRLGTISDSIATTAQIIADPTLQVIFPNTYLKHYCSVNSFELFARFDQEEISILPYKPGQNFIDTIYTVSPKTLNDTIIYFKSKSSDYTRTTGNRLTKWQVKQIKELSKGDKLIFESRVRCPGSTTWVITLTITII